MKRILQIVLISATLVMSGCVTPGRYPASGDVCKPTDPVKDLSATNCVVPAG